MTALAHRLLAEQRKRLVAAILEHCENARWYAELSHPEREALRERVIGSINVFYDLTRDLVKVTDSEDRNEVVLDLLRQLAASNGRIEQRIGAP